MPCVILSPLDCFWEGSKPLGPFPPNDEILGFSVAWKKFEPQALIKTLNTFGSIFDQNEVNKITDLSKRVI